MAERRHATPTPEQAEPGLLPRIGDRTAALLATRGLGVRFGKVDAVAGLDLTIPETPTRIGLIGESGSGKTTVLRALLGLTAPTAGDVRFRGAAVGELRGGDLAAFRSQVQPVFQDGNQALDPRMRVSASVAEGLPGRTPRRDREPAVAELLRAVNMDPALARRYPHELSGGQRQRVIIARALAARPRILLLDEPTSALDVMVQRHILELLEQLCSERDLSLLLVTHNLAVAQRLCETAHVMFGGRIVESGPMRQVLRRPAHPYTKALVAAVPALGGAPPVAISNWQAPAETGCAFRSRCPAATDICTAERPALEPDDNRSVACHHPLSPGGGAD